MRSAWLNGMPVAFDALAVDLRDGAFLLGDSVFETLHAQRGRLLRLERHRQRMRAGLEALGLPEPDWDAAQDGAAQWHRDSGLDDAVMRLSVGRGPLQAGFGSAPVATAIELLTARPRPSPPPGWRAATVDWPRRSPHALSARCKLGSYADQIAARRTALAAGAGIALMLGPDGRPVCADCASLLVFDRHRVIAPGPEQGALPGTLRAALLEALAASGFAVEQRAPGHDEVRDAPLALLANAVTGPVPLVELDGVGLRTDPDLLRRVLAAWSASPESGAPAA